MLLLVLAAAVVSSFGLAAESGGLQVRQVFRTERFTSGNVNLMKLQDIDDASWIAPPCAIDGSSRIPCWRFRRQFLGRSEPLVLDVSADARFVMLLDGHEIARGPHKGCLEHWYYQTYELGRLDGRTHELDVVVFDLGEAGPLSILTSGESAFILKANTPYHDDLTTGCAAWRVAAICGLSSGGVTDPDTMTGRENVVRGTGFLDFDDFNWQTPRVVKGPVKGNEYGKPSRLWALFPTERPDMLYRECRPGHIRAAQEAFAASNRVYGAADVASPWTTRGEALLKDGTPVTVPARTEVSFLWDLEDYYCAYPQLETDGGAGAEIRWAWTETLYNAEIKGHLYGNKGDRAAFLGKRLLRSMYDTFLPDGRKGARFTVPWWKSGRWIVLAVRTADEPLVLRRLGLTETRYPLMVSARFSCDDPSIDAIWRMAVRGMENCLHETFMDCPYFEQQMYPGDTRIEMLILNGLARDPRPVRYGIGIFDYARRSNGLVPMNFPTAKRQDSSTFSLIWTMMAGDYVRWYGVDAFLKARLPGVRQTLSMIDTYRNADGLLEGLPGWSFQDWVPSWDGFGNAPDGREGVSALNNLLYVYALKSFAEVERAFGEHAFARAWEEKSATVSQAVLRTFWDEKRGLVADTRRHDVFSEHAQVLALLADVLPPDRAERAFAGLLSASDLARATVYYSHYLFEVYLKRGRTDLFLTRLDLWRDFARQHLATPLEAPGWRGRSDCHAWGAHPCYHLLTGVAGIRPAASGFGAVEIAPQPGSLKFIRAAMPTPKGIASVDLQFKDGMACGRVEMPEGLPGTFLWQGRRIPLKSGENIIETE